MKVVHLASELVGGAGIAAARLNTALQNRGVESKLLYGLGEHSHTGNQRFIPRGPWVNKLADKLCDKLTWNMSRRDKGLFSRTYRYSKGGLAEQLSHADVVHLHWVAKWLDFGSIFRAVPETASVVITLHDANFFTGGCHQPRECTRYLQHCGHCPALRFPSRFDASSRGYRIRRDLYNIRPINVVPVSQWMADHCRQASLLSGAKHWEPIPPTVDEASFQPLPRNSCRDVFGIDHDAFVISAGCASLADEQKGIGLLVEAIKRLPSQARKNVVLLLYGHGDVSISDCGFQVVRLGYVSSERLLSAIYSSSDVYCTPSLMETFGMTVVEAGLCEIPSIVFSVGGLAEIVVDKATGWQVPYKDVEALSKTIESVIDLGDARKNVGVAARVRSLELCSPEIIADSYSKLYEQSLRCLAK